MNLHKPSEDNESHSAMEALDEIAENSWEFAKTRKADTAAFITMVVGVLVSIINPMLGGTLVGIITGLYFGPSLYSMLRRPQKLIDGHGMFKVVIGMTAILTLLIALPFFFIGCAITTAILMLAFEKKKNSAS